MFHKLMWEEGWISNHKAIEENVRENTVFDHIEV